MNQLDRNELQELILAAADWLAWILRYPQSADRYPEAIAQVMSDEAQALEPLSDRDVDRATSWLVTHLWQRLSQQGEEVALEEKVVLFETSTSSYPDETLRKMGEEALGLADGELALRLPCALSVHMAPTGEGFATAGWGGYTQILTPALSIEPDGALICFQVPLTEGARSVLRTLGATFVEGDRFICLSDEEQRQRAALTSHALPGCLEDGVLHLPPVQGGAATGAHLYRVLNASTSAWKPWLTWILAQRGCDFPWEAPRPAGTKGGALGLPAFEDELPTLSDRELAPGETAHAPSPATVVGPGEVGPLATLRQMVVETLARATLDAGGEVGHAQAVHALEAEGALSRWQALLDTVVHSLGQRERERLASATYVRHPADAALLVFALTGRVDLVLGEGREATLLLELPQDMGWVWGIPLEDLEGASRAERFVKCAFEYRLRNPYEVSFVRPDGQAARVPILYGITTVEKADPQFRWLASGEGPLPL